MVIRNASGDTDILVLSVSALYGQRNRISLDNGSGKNRQFVSLDSIDITEDFCSALIGLHALTGNDYNSSFFRKGKDKCWKLLEIFPRFLSNLQRLGTNLVLDEETIKGIEEYVCYLYGSKLKYLNQVRWKNFEQKFKKERKVIDLASLPPCKQVFNYHLERSNYIAYVWRNSINANIEMPPIQNHGWTVEGSIYWMNDAFPEDVEDLLAEDDSSDYEHELIGSDSESDDEIEL